VFWVISVYFNIRNTLLNSGTFLLGHPVYIYVCVCVCVSGISVVIATDYGLEGPGSNPGEDEIFRPSRRPWGAPSLL